MDPESSLLIFSKVSYLKLLVLVDSDALLLHPMEEREGEDGDGGDGWRNTSVFVVILSQNINFRDKILLLWKTMMARALT